MKYAEAKALVETITKLNYAPTEWERDFIKSIMERNQDLTVNQAKALTRVHEKATGVSKYQPKTV